MWAPWTKHTTAARDIGGDSTDIIRGAVRDRGRFRVMQRRSFVASDFPERPLVDPRTVRIATTGHRIGGVMAGRCGISTASALRSKSCCAGHVDADANPRRTNAEVRRVMIERFGGIALHRRRAA